MSDDKKPRVVSINATVRSDLHDLAMALDEVIAEHSEGLTYAEIVGALEMVKYETLLAAYSEEDEDE